MWRWWFFQSRLNVKNTPATFSRQFYVHIIVEFYIHAFMHPTMAFMWWRKTGMLKILLRFYCVGAILSDLLLTRTKWELVVSPHYSIMASIQQYSEKDRFQKTPEKISRDSSYYYGYFSQ